LSKLEGELGPECSLAEKSFEWSLNDYLGLANHPEVRKQILMQRKYVQHILWDENDEGIQNTMNN
jgi:7-keto-8-aminopelargonate synthetase-like enzyme